MAHPLPVCSYCGAACLLVEPLPILGIPSLSPHPGGDQGPVLAWQQQAAKAAAEESAAAGGSQAKLSCRTLCLEESFLTNQDAALEDTHQVKARNLGAALSLSERPAESTPGEQDLVIN